MALHFRCLFSIICLLVGFACLFGSLILCRHILLLFLPTWLLVFVFCPLAAFRMDGWGRQENETP